MLNKTYNNRSTSGVQREWRPWSGVSVSYQNRVRKKIKNPGTIIVVEGRNISNDNPGKLHPWQDHRLVESPKYWWRSTLLGYTYVVPN